MFGLRIGDDDRRRCLLGCKAGLLEDRPLAVLELPVWAFRSGFGIVAMIKRFQLVMRSHCKQPCSQEDLSNTCFPFYLFSARHSIIVCSTGFS